MKKNPGRKERRRQMFQKDRLHQKRCARINHFKQIKKERNDKNG